MDEVDNDGNREIDFPEFDKMMQTFGSEVLKW